MDTPRKITAQMVAERLKDLGADLTFNAPITRNGAGWRIDLTIWDSKDERGSKAYGG